MFYYPNKPVRLYHPEDIMEVLDPTWVVQPKWDGKRIEISCVDDQIRMFSRQGREWSTRGWEWLNGLNLPQPWYLDGELLRDNRIVCWDFAVIGGREAYKDTYQTRLTFLQDRLSAPQTGAGNTFALVDTLAVESSQELLGREGEPFLEGVVWKDLEATDLWGPWSTKETASQFKYRFL